MSDIRREKTQTSQLGIGMFVCELDRPWLGTPFMLEGLLIEDQEQIATISSMCEFVYIDRTVSVGNYFTTPPKKQVSIKRSAVASHAQDAKNLNKNTDIPTKSAVANNKFSFFDVLREIKVSNQNMQIATKKRDISDTLMFNVQYGNHNSDIYKTSHLESNDETSLSSQIKADFSNFISSLTTWGGSKNKVKSKINEAELDKPLEKEEINNIASTSESPPVEEEIANIYPVYEKSQIATREIFEALAQNKKIDLTNIYESLNSMVESIERNADALIWLAKLKQTDDYAYNHALNVSITLMALAIFMSLPKKQVKDLGLAGLLQDIGKAKIPYALLHKKEKVTDEEIAILKTHVDYALELLEVTENISSTVILTVSQHHERFDGSGYPYQLASKQISLSGQMAGLIDTYCALTSNKVYARGVYNQIALEEIHRSRDVKFSGVLIDQLVQFLGIYPVSSLIELNTGEVAVVIQQNSVRRLLPRVMILLNPDKTKNDYPATINLINSPLTPNGELYTIVKGLPPDSYGLNANNYYG